MKSKAYRFRRILAGAIDWNLSCLPAFLICMLLLFLDLSEKILIPLAIPLVLSFPALFLFRDRLWKGRSLGNRIMKLVVLDRRTLEPLPASALTTRNLMFLFLSSLDILFLLTTGATLGDRAVAALVVHQDEIPAQPPQKPASNTKTVLVTVLAVILGIALLIGIVLVSLESIKDEPHYALAYDYLVSSETFAGLDAEEDQIRLSGYNRSTTTRNGVTETEAIFTFQVKGYSLTVTCHKDDTGWYVCEECTQFH